MSRKVEAKSSVIISEEETAIRDTGSGKLIFSRYHGRGCVLLLKNHRLTAAAFPEKSKVGAIYTAKVKNVVKNVDACFVEITEGEICFLPMREATSPFLLNRKYDGRILEGDELLVQVIRDAQKGKQASVTTQISLSNDYFAIVSGSTKVGYSKKLDRAVKERINYLFTEHAIFRNGNLIQGIESLLSAAEYGLMEKEGLKPDSIELPATGCIVRTKAAELSDAEAFMSQFFDATARFVRLLHVAAHRSCFSCLKKPFTALEAVLQQLVDDREYQEFVTDDEDYYQELQEYCEEHGNIKPVRFYQDKTLSLSKLYSLESRLEVALGERVWLKSGGYLIIQPTEALTVIDVNSGKFQSRRNDAEEESILKVNREAAEEIALQLRLRNLSGIIIVDFINMKREEHRQEIMGYLRGLIQRDKVKTTVVDMTPLGLVEITRKKITKPLYEQLQSE